MELEPWDPWSEFAKVRAEADQLLQSFFARVEKIQGSRPLAFIPTADVVETREDLRILLSLPGVVEEDIEISFEEGMLVVRGERERPYDETRDHSHLGEWRYGYFERRFELLEEIDVDGISATFRMGVLTVVVPKRASAGGGASRG